MKVLYLAKPPRTPRLSYFACFVSLRECFLGLRVHRAKSRFPASSAVMPHTATLLILPVSPERIVTALLGTSSISARKQTSALFALPSTGGARRRILTVPSISPLISSFEALGTTFTRISIPSPVLMIASQEFVIAGLEQSDDKRVRPLNYEYEDQGREIEHADANRKVAERSHKDIKPFPAEERQPLGGRK